MSFFTRTKGAITLAALAIVVLAYMFWGPVWFFILSLMYVILGLILLFYKSKLHSTSPSSTLIFYTIITQSYRSLEGIFLALSFAVAVFGWFADGVSNQQWTTALGAFVFAFGNIVWASWLAPLPQTKGDKTVLVTGLSSLRNRALDDFLREDIHSFENLILAACDKEEANQRATGAGSSIKTNNLLNNRMTPILSTIAKYKGIKSIKLIIVKDTLADYQFDDVRQVIRQVFPGRFDSGSIVEIPLHEVEHWDAEGIYEGLRKYISTNDCDINQAIIALTNGTAAMTAALTLIALEGDARPVYFKQNQDCNLIERVVEFKNWNAKRIEHLFDQILNTLQS